MVFRGIDEEYAEQVTAEQKVTVRQENGIPRQVWQKKDPHGDNHYLDAEVYALAAADIRRVRTLHLQGEDPQENLIRKKEEPETQEEQWIRVNENWLGG